ncbi:MAG: diguanylate cyclase, partial [Raoultibacter sp.]
MRTHPNSPPTPAELILLEALGRNTTIGVKLCECSGAGCILYANDGFAELTGYRKEELTRSDCTLVVRPTDKEQLLQEIRTQADALGYFKITYQLRRKDGSLIWVLDSGILIRQQNEPDIVQSVVTDISAQKQAEQELKANKARYEIALDFSDVMMFEYDIDTKTIFTHASDLTTYGLPNTIENGVETIIDSGIIQDRSKDDFRTLYQKIDEGAPCASATIYVKDIKGNERTLQMQIISFFDEEKKPTYTLGVRKDITNVVQLHKEKEYGSQLTEKHLFLYEANVTQNKILYFNPHWAHTVGLSDPAVFSEVVRYVCEVYVSPEDATIFTERQTQSFLLDSFKRGERLVTFEYRKRGGVNDKRYRWFEAKINIVQDELSNDINVRVYSLNIDKKKEADSALLYQAQHDLMTGFYNKNTTEDKINAVLSSVEGSQQKHIFFIVDLDYFKLINDRFGHAFGDAVLSQSATKIANLFRSEDIFGRIGGDEFVVFMKNVINDKIAFFVAQEICDTLTETYQQN